MLSSAASSVGAHGAPPAASVAVFSLHRARKSCTKKKKKKRNPTGLHKSLYTRGGGERGRGGNVTHRGWMASVETLTH